MERTNVVTSKGNPVTLVGPELKVGDKAPEFSLTNGTPSPVKLSDSAGKPRLMSVVPSLDTGVCSLQTRTFNQKVGELADKVGLYTISVDLPFAQSRFREEHNIDNFQILSDHAQTSFGTDYGLLIKEARLLARAVLVVGKDDTITYIQVVPEVSTEPDYESALAALKKLVE